MSGAVKIMSPTDGIEQFWGSHNLSDWPTAWSPTQPMPEAPTPTQFVLSGNMTSHVTQQAQGLQQLFEQTAKRQEEQMQMQDHRPAVTAIKMMEECNGDHYAPSIIQSTTQKVDSVREQLYRAHPHLSSMDQWRGSNIDHTPPVVPWGTPHDKSTALLRQWAHNRGFPLHTPWGQGEHDKLVVSMEEVD